MIGSTARLVDPATGTELVSYGAFTATAGILEQLDLGFPQPRESTTNRSGAHGMHDTTRWAGARAITMQVGLPAPPDTDQAVDNLTGCLNPSLRLWLYVQRPYWDRERRILVRGSTFTCPPGVMRRAQVGLIAPDAMLEDSLSNDPLVLQPSGTGTGGLSLPLAPPITFAPGVVSGAAFINVGGNAPAPFVVDMFGPCQDPQFLCVTTGEQVKFTGLTLNVGDFLRVDTGAGTALLNGLIDQSRMNFLDFTLSNPLMTLAAGQSSEVAFAPTAPSGNCQAILTFRNRWF